MRVTISLNTQQLALLDKMMREDHQTNRSTYIVYLMSQEEKARTRRPAGRPRKNEDVSDDEMPDENEPRTMQIPADLKEYAPHFEQDKLVNAYDIAMLEAKRDYVSSRKVNL